MYVGSFVVCQRLEFICKDKGRSWKSKKSWWESGLKKNIDEWWRKLDRVKKYERHTFF